MFTSSVYTFFFFNATATTEIYTLSLHDALPILGAGPGPRRRTRPLPRGYCLVLHDQAQPDQADDRPRARSGRHLDRKSTRLNSSHVEISYAVFCLKKKNKTHHHTHSHAIPTHDY